MAGDARAGVMVDFDDKIVEPVGALEAVAWFIGRRAEWPVVAPVRGVLAPGIICRYAPDRKEGPRARQAVRSPPNPKRMELPGRCGAVAFAFRRLDARPAQSRSNRTLPCHEPSLRTQPRAHVYVNRGQRGLAYRIVFSSRHERSRICRRRVPQAQVFRSKLSIALTFCGHMIFSENRFPLFRIML